jgi:hypothetical protein
MQDCTIIVASGEECVQWELRLEAIHQCSQPSKNVHFDIPSVPFYTFPVAMSLRSIVISYLLQ